MISRCTRILFLLLPFGIFCQISFAQTSCGVISGIITVSNTDDEGEGSLRNAIICANSVPDAQRIVFNIEEGTGTTKTIFVGRTTGEPLPALIDDGTIIEGTSQTGSGVTPRIVLDGRQVNWDAPVNGLLIQGNQCEVYGLEIRNFPGDGIDVSAANEVKIGQPLMGNVIHSCGEERDFYENSNPEGPWEGSGIVLRNGASNCIIKSNFIGSSPVNLSNPLVLPNEFCGIYITGNSNSNRIGGIIKSSVIGSLRELGEGNIIAFNPTAIRVEGSVNNTLLGNSIVCSPENAIVLANGGNNLKAAPSIITATNEEISGRGIPSDQIEIFLNTSRVCEESSCQAQLSIGQASVQADSTWKFEITGTASVGNIDFLEFDLTTAIAIGLDGNTSGISSCRIVDTNPNECAETDGTIWVTNTDDDGAGSLRRAIECANNIGGPNTIKFNIEGGGRQTINVGTTTLQALPALTDPNTIIDATTQNGFGENGSFEPQIILDGSETIWVAPWNALWIRANNCAVYGLEIRNFPDDGIDVTSANNVTIGAEGKGNVIYNCGAEQDFWEVINPSGPWEGCGVVVKGGSLNVSISGNILGTNYNRDLNAGNEFCGINVSGGSSNLVIGGNTPAAGNVIAYNPSGIILGNGTSRIQMLGNSFLCNDTLAIGFRGTANNGILPPTIEDYTTSVVSGTANAGDRIEVYISSTDLCPDQPCQGRIFLGSVVANNGGEWELEIAADDTQISDVEVVTATATNASGNTSGFSDCYTQADVDCSSFTIVLNKLNTTCESDNGKIFVTATGGTTPYTYDIGNGPTNSPEFADLAVGTYSISVIDANGCQATPQAIAINQSDPITFFTLDERNAVCDQATGQFSVFARGGEGEFTYDIGNGPTSDVTFTNLLPGDYEVTVTDRTGCSETDIVTIGNDPGIELTLSEVNDASCGENNGSAIANISGGQAPISYRLNGDLSSSGEFDNLPPGEYELIVSDANGCSAEDKFVIEATPELQLEIADIQDADCDATGGVITVSTNGGTAPISFNYGTGATTETTFEDLFAGTYIITATDANGCTSTTTARIEASGNLEVSIENIVDASCDRENGGFTVSPLNGEPPYRYALSSQNRTTEDPVFTDLPAGEYTVFIADSRGCETMQDVVVGKISPLTFEIANIQSANCDNGSRGSFTIFASGGTIPISYDIGEGATFSPSFSNLPAGDYMVTATDAIGCTFEREITIEQIGALEIERGVVRDATCGQANGSYTIGSATGQAPYQYQIEGRELSSSLNALEAGEYEVLIVDANGCSTTTQVVIQDRNDLEVTFENINNASCGQSNGQFTISASNGIAPYTYLLVNSNIGETDNPTFENLSGGSYNVIITDANGCEITENIFIEESAPMVAEVVEIVDASCGQANGGFEVEVTSGTPPFQYDIGFGVSDSPTFKELQAGTYTVSITDANGCDTKQTLTIESTTTELATDIDEIIDATCGEDNGGFEVVVDNGTAPYTYNIGNGATDNSVFTDLAPGVYSVTVMDAAACEAVHDLTVVRESEAISASISSVRIAECGQSNGSFQITGTGGRAPYRYNIGQGQTLNNNFTNLSGGVYEVTVIDNKNCTTIEQIIIEETEPVTANIINIEGEKCEQSNGQFEVNVNSGLAPFEYNIGNGFTDNPVFEELTAGTYNVTIRDVNGCESTEQVGIEATGEVLQTTVQDLQNTTCGEDNGRFIINVSNGEAPFTYIIGNEEFTSPVFSDLPTGIYEILILDAAGCSAEERVTIEQASEVLTTNIQNIQNTSCGEDNGSFSINVTNGEAPFTYIIGNEEFENSDFSNLSIGTYDVLILDVAGCTSEEQVIIEADDIPIEANITDLAIAECGQSNGRFNINVSGGTAPYTYNIGFGERDNPEFTQVSGGIYQLTITDAIGCSITRSVEVEETPPISAEVVLVEAESCGQSNGSFSIEVISGVAPYRYDVGNGFVANPNFAGLVAGDYEVTVQDANGCTTSELIIIEASNTALSTNIDNILDATCGEDNGGFEVIVSNGNAPYTYNIGNGETDNPSFTNLAPDVYSVTVTDAESCEAVHDLTIVRESDAISANVSELQIAECGQSNGSFQITGIGGRAPYRYNIGQGQTLNNNFTNLSGGVYEVTIIDNKNCSIVESITIEETVPVTASIINLEGEKCEQSNGQFEVSINSGVAPFEYSIGNEFTDDPVFTELTAGTYNVTIRDANGCESTEQVGIEATGEVLQTTVQSLQNTTCGEENGGFSIVVSNGEAPYTYIIGNEEFDSPDFANLPVGIYEVLILDAAGCSAEERITIEAGDSPIEANISDLAIAQCGQSNGRFNVNVSGGTAPYTYNIGFGEQEEAEFTRVSGGVYNLTITDATGCSIVESIEVEETAPLTTSIINLEAEKCDQANGSFEVNIQSGTAPFVYSLGTDFTDNPVFENLEAGDYELIIQDANGCESVEVVIVEATGSTLETSVQNIQNTTCGEENGSFSVNVTSGEAPYTYIIDDEEFDSPDFTNLAPGTYTIQVFDAAGCSSEEEVSIEAGDTEMEANIGDISIARCGQSNGRFDVNVIGGTAPYTYNIGFGERNDSEFTQVSGGVYDLTITDANGCFITEQIEIEETPPLTLNTINLEAATCGQDNGGFELEVQSGTAPYSFNIGDGTSGNGIFTDLAAGSYTVTVVDANGCSNTQQIAIEQSETELSANIDNLQNANCGEENGRFSVVVNNGSAPYSYDLGEGATNDPNFTGLALGNYEITVSDASGCSTILEVEIGQGTDSVSGEVVQNLNATCGQSNGSLTVQAVSGVAPFTYDIGFGASTIPLFSNLSQGIYNITITDVNGCQGTLEAAVEETNPITADAANLQDATCGENNGQFEITVNSGTAPFSYNIGNGVTPSNRFTNLEGGTYNVTITDANFCSATIQVNIEQTPPVSAEVQELVATSCGEANGGVSISASGGVAPYQYNIGNGASENNTFSNLAGGSYEVTIIDSEGCQSTQSIEIPNSSEVTARLIGPTGAYCGQDNGTLAVIAEGGVEPYRYDIGNGITSDPNFGNLAAGDYVVTITDAQNCTTTLNARVDFTSVVEVSVRKENDFCGNGEGSITLVPNGGTAPYTYDIGEGPSSNNTFENVFPGTYNITVTDAAGCEAITTTTVTATSDLNVAILSRKRPTCGNDNGRIVVSAGSGVAPYQFNIGNGAVSSNTFEGLAPGTYTVTITDDVSCNATVSIELPAESEAPTAIITNKLDVSCAGNDGQFTVEASGGLAPYTYTVGGAASTNPVFEEMPTGNYDVTITDANGCEIIESVSIEGETTLEASIAEVQNENCDAENAAFQVNAIGGTAPYRYDIGNGLSSNNNYSNLASGVYTVTIVDARDCQTTEQVTIESVNDLSASISNQSAASCAVADGAFTIIPIGGTAPYRYNIGNGFTASPRFENLASGSYNLTVSDANGCTFQTNATVEGTDAPEGSVTNLGDATCGKDNGSVSLLAFGGQSPYTYNIGNGSGLGNGFEDLAAGDYIATITDANGCASSVSFSIGMIGNVPTASFIIDTSGLEIELENTSTGADSSSWDLGDGVIYDGDTVIHEYEDGGIYTICLTTMNECGSTTDCQSITLTSTVKKADLAGMIFTELDLPVSEVNMLCTGMDTIQTGIEGLYSFDNLVTNSTYEVQPSKTDGILNGLSTFDIFLINNHILAKERLDSPYKIIAADLNLSGTVTTFDVVMLRKLLLGTSDELPNGNTSWRFVDASYQFPDPTNPFLEAFPNKAVLNLEDDMEDVDFIAVKVGDVNNSMITTPGANFVEGRSTQWLEAAWSTNYEEIILSVPAGIVGLQFTLEYDVNMLEIESVQPSKLADLSGQNFGLHRLENGQLTASWNTTHSLKQAHEFVRLRVRNTAVKDLSKVLKITSSITAAEAFSSTELYDLNLKIVEPKALKVNGNAPNPFDTWTQLNFELTSASKVRLQLFNANGSLLRTIEEELLAGEQNMIIERRGLPAGVIYYRLENNTEAVTGKIVAMD